MAKKGASVHVISSAGKFSNKNGRSAKSLSRSASQHKVYKEKGWSVRKSESSRAGRVFHTKEEAVRYARDVARRHQSEVYIHRRDGTIMERDSYGPEQLPPRNSRGR